MTNYFHLLNFAVYYLLKLSSAWKSMPLWENSLGWWCYSQYMWKKQQTHVYSGIWLINVGSGCQSWLAKILKFRTWIYNTLQSSARVRCKMMIWDSGHFTLLGQKLGRIHLSHNC